MQDYYEIYMLTVDQSNFHEKKDTKNEDNMLDWEGNIVEKKHRNKILLSEVEDN